MSANSRRSCRVKKEEPYVVEVVAEPGEEAGSWAISVQGIFWECARTDDLAGTLKRIKREAKKVWSEQLGFQCKVEVIYFVPESPSAAKEGL